MTTSHHHDVTSMQFMTQCDIPVLFYKTEESLPTQQNNFYQMLTCCSWPKQKARKQNGIKNNEMKTHQLNTFKIKLALSSLPIMLMRGKLDRSEMRTEMWEAAGCVWLSCGSICSLYKWFDEGKTCGNLNGDGLKALIAFWRFKSQATEIFWLELIWNSDNDVPCHWTNEEMKKSCFSTA